MRNWKSLLTGTILLWLTLCAAAFGQKAELVVQTGHSNIVGATAFSADGKYIVTGDGFAKVLILWETFSGKELRRFVGHDNAIIAVAFSHDGQSIASVSKDKTLRKWDVMTGRELLKIDLTAHKDKMDGDEPLNVLAFGNNDRAIIASTKTSLSKSDFPQEQSLYRPANFSADVKMSAIKPSMQIWNAVDGTLLKNEKLIEPLTISSDGRIALVWQTTSLHKDNTTDGQYVIWDLATHRPISQLKNLTPESIRNSVFSFDNTKLNAIVQTEVISSKNLNTRISYSANVGNADSLVVKTEFMSWEVSTGQQQTKIERGISDGKSILVQKNTRHSENYVLFSACLPEQSTREETELYRICSLDMETGEKTEIKLNRFLTYSNSIFSVAASADGNFVAFGTGDSTTTVLKVEDKKTVSWLSGKMPYVADVIVGADNASISTVAEDETVTRWDLTTGQPVLEKQGKATGKGVFEKYIDVVSSNGKLRFTENKNGGTLQNAETNEEISLLNHPDCTFSSESSYFSIGCVQAAAFSPDNLFVATGDYKGVVRLWSATTGKIIKTFEGHSGIVYGLAFMPDGKTLVSGSMDSTTRLWNVETGKEKARLITAFDGSWTVITPEGLFDASPKARKLMHYVVGLEVITLEQMKDIYYVPGLLKKIFKGESLPNVESFSGKDLFPLAEYAPLVPNQKQLSVKLTNRGGGIGQVRILVNGKEFVADARPSNFDSSQKTATISVNLADAPFYTGKENKIEIVTRNAAGSLNSRGSSRGSEIVQIFNYGAKSEPPNIYAIVGGISNYTGDNLKLNFAAKDAEDFAKAFEVGASKLFGAGKVHLRLLTSNGENTSVKFSTTDARVSMATKADFAQAFADFKNATPNDIFIVYLAGHGVSLNLNQNSNQPGGDTYLYLTQEATTSDKSVLAVENSRRAMAISSDELTELMKGNQALKQVLVLDTCAAGAAANSLTAKRDLPSDQIRAIDRLNDRTGFFVLMGAASDKVSYEASQYGQGLLTYALLQGMKGARLRENQYADVGTLFGYAADTVPEMAKNIGGIQRPLVIAPDASGSFDIGKFTAEEQKQIALTAPKPVILRPNLRNSALRFDNLKLTQMLTERLREMNYAQSRGTSNPLVFVETDEMTDAILPSGDYTVEGETIKISLILVKNNAAVGKEISITGKASDPAETVERIIKAMILSL